MGGFGGMGGTSRFSFDSEQPLGGGMGGMPNVFTTNMGGSSGGPGRPKRRDSGRGTTGARTANTSTESASVPTEITKPLKVKLEDLALGTVKKMKITRRLLDGEQVEKTLEINILPGFKAGTKFRFKGEGNEREGVDPADLVFVLEELPHDKFTRDGNDVITTEKISLLEALTGNGGSRQITVLDGRRPTVTVPASVVKPGSQTRLPGYGMPIRKEGQVRDKGDLIVKWEVEFPERLTTSQKEGLKKVLG
jgi:DnaJ family protein B protein 4